MGFNIKQGFSRPRIRASEFVKEARERLGKSQSELAALLSISTKAVQSYEQGWRDVPSRVLRDAMVLLALAADSSLLQTPCWEVARCPPESVENCPSYRLSHGRMCWFVACSRCTCAETEKAAIPQLKCLDCPVIARFFA